MSVWCLSYSTTLSLKTAAVSVRISLVILSHFLLHIIMIAFIFFGPYWLVTPGPILTLVQYQSSHVRSDHVLGSAMPNIFTTDLTMVFGVFCVQQVWVWNTGIVSKLSCMSINDNRSFVSTYIVLSYSRLFKIHFDIRCSHFKKIVSIDAI